MRIAGALLALTLAASVKAALANGASLDELEAAWLRSIDGKR